MTKWVRADHAQAEKEAAVAAAYEDAAEIARRRRKVMHGKTLGAIFAIVDALPDAIRARATTDALAARDARVRAEALREAAGRACSFAASCFNHDEDDAGASVSAAADSILALIPTDQEGDG